MRHLFCNAVSNPDMARDNARPCSCPISCSSRKSNVQPRRKPLFLNVRIRYYSRRGSHGKQMRRMFLCSLGRSKHLREWGGSTRFLVALSSSLRRLHCKPMLVRFLPAKCTISTTYIRLCPHPSPAEYPWHTHAPPHPALLMHRITIAPGKRSAASRTRCFTQLFS